MAECKTNLALVQVRSEATLKSWENDKALQVNYWSEIIEEIIIILTILGAIIAFVFSLLIMKILATR